MVRRVKLPGVLRQHLSGNEMSGWMDGIEWTPRQRRRRRVRIQRESVPLVPCPVRFESGQRIG